VLGSGELSVACLCFQPSARVDENNLAGPNPQEGHEGLRKKVRSVNVGAILQIEFGYWRARLFAMMDLSRAVYQDIDSSGVALQVRHERMYIRISRQIGPISTGFGRPNPGVVRDRFERLLFPSDQAHLGALGR
jgi:hypothetical protein